MNKHEFFQRLNKVVLLTLVFLLGSQPILVAAMPEEMDARQEVIDSLTSSGDIYLTNISTSVSLSVELVNSVSAIKNTPFNQLSESAVYQARTHAIEAAEASATALGATNNLANSIEAVGGSLPLAFDPFSKAQEGLPVELRDDLQQEVGLSITDVDAISTGMSDLLLSRQSMLANGMPADVASQLAQAGFSQAEIDQIAVVAGKSGLANTDLTTGLSQFRASQDEWSAVGTNLLILNIQLLGYQIGVRQNNGIEPQPTTDAELQEITEDELRVLIHVAHLQELWGIDPDLNIGEGDWWFIEHYAGRAAERLDSLILTSQNRGLVQDLLALQKIRLLALSARSGDADYVKTELDAMSKVLAYLTGNEGFVSTERQELKGYKYIFARIITNSKLREKFEWPVAHKENERVLKHARARLTEAQGQDNLAVLYGMIRELNETNNAKSILFLAGLSFTAQLRADVLQASLYIVSQATPANYVTWLKAILTGDTDNPILLGANIFLSLIPVIGAIPDIVTLVIDQSMFVKALSLVGIIGSLGDLAGLIPGLQGVAGGSFLGDAAATVMKVLFKNMDWGFRKILDLLSISDSFDVIIDFLRVTLHYVGSSIGHSVSEVVQFLQNLFTGNFALWENFTTFVRRVGGATLRAMGFDDGSNIVGIVLRRGNSLTDPSIGLVDRIADDLVAELSKVGVRLSDEAAEGLARATKIFNEAELRRLLQKVGNGDPRLTDNYLRSLQKISLDNDIFLKTGNLKNKVGVDNLAKLITEFAGNPNDLELAKYIFGVLGDSSVSTEAVKTAVGKGPQAAKAFSFWNMAMLQDDYIVKELAQRAGKDALALGKLDELLRLTPAQLSRLDQDPAKRLIAEIAANSTHGSGNRFVLGIFSEYDAGYVWYARYLENTGVGSLYYHSHPEIYNTLVRNLPTDPVLKDKILWAVNEQALNVPIGQRLPFEYSLFNVPEQEGDFIKGLWSIGEDLRNSGSSDAFIEATFDDLINDEYNKIPGRMKELKKLFFNGYRNVSSDPVANSLRITP